MIDVIIPIYNTEKYLCRCLDSILEQTFQDFELILIDDGSTDASGRICDEYADRDSRITVLHQENRGQAAARNVGIEWALAHSESEWLAFIDSDDWVSSHYLEVLMQSVLHSQCEISACEYREVKDSAEYDEELAVEQIISPEDFYCERNMLSVVPWAKLFAKKLWEDIRFPEGIIHEDEFVTYKIVFAVKKIAHVSTPMYCYFVNPKGTMHSEWSPARLTAFEGKQKQIHYMQKNGYQKAFLRAVLSYAKIACWQLKKINKEKYPQEAASLRKQLRKHIRQYKKSGVFSRRKTREIYIAAFPVEMSLLDRMYVLKRKLYSFLLKIKYKPHVMDSKRTMEYILKNKCSVSRYGDGEFGIMMRFSNIGFQESSEALSEKLHDVLKNPPDDCLICVPDVFGSLAIYNENSRHFWKRWLERNDNRRTVSVILRECRGQAYRFGNALFTRPYIEYPDEKNALTIFPLIKKLWNNRDVLIVEGTQTRIGVNNDLLDNAASVHRILAPAVNAFGKYSEIISATEKVAGDKLILLALGPTATVMACELCRKGYWAIDIGHIDIEYEWFLRKATEKIAIPGKYTNEAKDGSIISGCHDPVYQKQIICVIE